MLVWELCYQRVPYDTMKLQEIQEHVLGMKRETLEILLNPSPIPRELASFIKWGKEFVRLFALYNVIILLI